jgi:hypothetical protein
MSKEAHRKNVLEGCSEISNAGDPDFLGELAQAREQDRRNMVQWLRACMVDCIEIMTRKKSVAESDRADRQDSPDGDSDGQDLAEPEGVSAAGRGA